MSKHTQASENTTEAQSAALRRAQEQLGDEARARDAGLTVGYSPNRGAFHVEMRAFRHRIQGQTLKRGEGKTWDEAFANVAELSAVRGKR